MPVASARSTTAKASICTTARTSGTTESGELTWRGQGQLGVYCTHSLGPLLYITGDRVRRSARWRFPAASSIPKVTNPTMHLMQMVTDQRARHSACGSITSRRARTKWPYYALQGTRGAFESWRGNGDASKIWLEDEHEPSTRPGDGAQWHDLSSLAAATTSRTASTHQPKPDWADTAPASTGC